MYIITGVHVVAVLNDVVQPTLLLQARNLVYMVQKRERMKKQLLQSEAEHFELESRLLEEEVGEEEEEEEEVFSAPPSPAQTRCILDQSFPTLCISKFLQVHVHTTLP